MNGTHDIYIQGIPTNIPEPVAAVYRSRFLNATNRFLDETGIENVKICIGTSESTIQEESYATSVDEDQKKSDYDLSVKERARKYEATNPFFDFDRLVISDKVEEDILLAIDLIDLEHLVFDVWGLREIEPFPRMALNFHGEPGTGKTLAAHAIASKINRQILIASYAQIESMYHGEGPKNVEAIFFAAERDNAVLFIDEADSLLSKRLTNVTQGSEQAINSMRSQLLICLEQFRGIVIFSTNLVKNYDKAFETRVLNIHFSMPDKICRQEIWKKHFPSKLPLSEDVSPEKLANVEDVCGRDIKNAVIGAAMRVARQRKDQIRLHDLLKAVDHIKASRISVIPDSDKLNSEEVIRKKFKNALSDNH